MSAIKDQLSTMVERRASKGHNFDQSMELLLELCNAHSGNNLATALVYDGYATEKQASRFTQHADV